MNGRKIPEIRSPRVRVAWACALPENVNSLDNGATRHQSLSDFCAFLRRRTLLVLFGRLKKLFCEPTEAIIL